MWGQCNDLATGQIRYEFRCAPSQFFHKDPSHYEANTPWNQYDPSKIYLDRHNVKCEDGYVLSGFHFQRDNNRCRYEARCVKSNLPLKCYPKRTESSDIGDYISYLSSQSVSGCGENEAIQQFHFNREGSNRMYYDYTCCSQEGQANFRLIPTIHHSNPSTDDAGNIATLDRQYVACKRYTPLNRFYLQSEQPDFFKNSLKNPVIHYEYDCLETGNRFPHMDQFFNTREDFSGGNGLIYLDRHDVSCTEYRGLLTSFRFWNYEGMVHYEYNCVKYDQYEMSCRNVETSRQSFDNRLVFLDRHNIACDGNF
jgi:hypothetical protein